MVLVMTLSGSLGALCRYLVTGAIHRRISVDFPTGTMAVNLSGAFFLGVVAGWPDINGLWLAVVGGFLGGFTTFSTWMIETVRFGEVRGLRPRAFMNLLGTLFIGVALAALGYTLTS